MPIRHSVCKSLASPVAVGAILWGLSARAEEPAGDAGVSPDAQVTSGAAEAQTAAPVVPKESAALPEPSPPSPPAAPAPQLAPQRESAAQICGVPCLLPQQLRQRSHKSTRNPNPVIILCQNDDCRPYSVGCPPGTVFDGNSNCVSLMTLDPFEPIRRRESEARQSEESMATRVRHRMRPRLTLEMDVGLGLIREPELTSQVAMFSARGMLGYRVQFAPQVGLQVRAGGRLGLASYHSQPASYESRATAAEDQMLFGGGVLELMPFVGPFGRVYVGPIGQLGYMKYEKNALRSGEETVRLPNGLTAGAGVHGGVALTDKERVAIHFSTLVAYQNGLALLLTVGVGCHL